ncbi:hypothetical protein QE152_g40459 [Popillia japonica]|uniref:Uncharacterized protein n=1 Tax=Popillia japonica TaxID=7064 RepID=A0AAW1HHN3_POPJA
MSLVEESLEEGTIEFVKTKTETTASKGRKQGSSRTLYMLPYSIQPEGVSGIDGDIESHEIVEAIKDNMDDIDANGIRVVSIRPNQYGSQNATVIVGKGMAKELVRKGRIKIGWIMCHPGSRVAGSCGSHRVKESTGKPFCFSCNKEGHSAEQTKCPYFRKLIREKTKELASGNPQHLAYAVANQRNIDILVVSEPNKKRVGGHKWLKDCRVDVAVLCLTRNLDVLEHKTTEGHLILNLKTMTIICCYISPNISLQDTLDLEHGYFQFSVEESSILKTAFLTKDRTHKFTRMMFGLTKAPVEFVRLMNTVLGPMRRFAKCFLDDVHGSGDRLGRHIGENSENFRSVTSSWINH